MAGDEDRGRQPTESDDAKQRAKEKKELEHAEKVQRAREKEESKRREEARVKEEARRKEEAAKKDAAEKHEREKQRRKVQNEEHGSSRTSLPASASQSSLPTCMSMLPSIQPETQDLVVGTLIVFTAIAAYAFQKQRTQRAGRQRAMSRSLSCPAIVELKSERALAACADMMAAFDEYSTSPTRSVRRPSLAPTLPACPEADGESSSAWTPRSTPRSSLRGSRRASPGQRLESSSPRALSPQSSVLGVSDVQHHSPRSSRATPRESPWQSPRQSYMPSPRTSPPVCELERERHPSHTSEDGKAASDSFSGDWNPTDRIADHQHTRSPVMFGLAPLESGSSGALHSPLIRPIATLRPAQELPPPFELLTSCPTGESPVKRAGSTGRQPTCGDVGGSEPLDMEMPSGGEVLESAAESDDEDDDSSIHSPTVDRAVSPKGTPMDWVRGGEDDEWPTNTKVTTVHKTLR